MEPFTFFATLKETMWVDYFLHKDNNKDLLLPKDFETIGNSPEILVEVSSSFAVH